MFTWKKRVNLGFGLMLIGLTGIVQAIVVLHAQSTLQVTSIYLLVLIPFGASITLSGVELSITEAIYKRFATREKRITKWKKGRGGTLRSLLGKLEIVGIISGSLVLVFSFVLYLLVVIACEGTGIPYYVRFVLAESVSTIALAAIGIIVKLVIDRKGIRVLRP